MQQGNQSKEDITMGRFLSLVLRHQPQAAFVSLDAHGYVDVDDLIAGVRRTGRKLDHTMLHRIVAENNKQRYSFNEDGSKIRASQGHSLAVDVELKQQTPPSVLFHGTSVSALSGIREEGISRQNRQHVHLSADEATARKVGSRHGKPIVLRVNAAAMHEEGYLFYLSENQVWLCDYVPWRFVQNP